ncbi:145_t:CDS:2, partial [Cetraspora pellucida]
GNDVEDDNAEIEMDKGCYSGIEVVRDTQYWDTQIITLSTLGQ